MAKKINFWRSLKTPLIKFLKSKGIKFLLKKLFIVGGFEVWIVTYILEELFDEFAKPFMEHYFRKHNLRYNIQDGEHKLERIENAENDNDWRDAVRDS